MLGGCTSPSAAPSVKPSGTPSVSVPVRPCASDQLTSRLVEAVGAAGTMSALYGLRDRSPHPCTLKGFPDVSFFTSAGHRLHVKLQRSDNIPPISVPPRRVQLAPGASAYFVIAYGDMPALSFPCVRTGAIVVGLPSHGGTIRITAKSEQITYCAPGISVSPFLRANPFAG